MPLARYHKQRRVTRGSWKPRFTKQKGNWRGTTKPTMPTVTSLAPSTAVHGTGADVTMIVTGTGFVSGLSKITWDGLDEPTTFISATQVSTLVRPSTALSPKVAVVRVRNATLVSTTSQNFTLT